MSTIEALSGVFAEMGARPGSCLTVGNISENATPREVHILFSGCQGYVKSYLAFDANRKRLCGIVNFSSEENAKRAAETRKGTTWDGELEIKIDLGRPTWMEDAAMELRMVQHDRPSLGGRRRNSLAPRKEYQQMMTPAAQAAYSRLNEAIKSRHIPCLKDAIEDGKLAGLNDEELREGTDALNLSLAKQCVTQAASNEQRAWAIMKKALASVEDAMRHLTQEQIDDLENAMRVGGEAANVCKIVGLPQGERRLRAISREIADTLQLFAGPIR